MATDTSRVGIMEFRAAATENQVRADEYGNQTFSQSLPPLADLARNRKIFGHNSGTNAGVAPVAAVPTTAAQFYLFNSSETLSIIILSAYQWLIGGTTGLGSSMWGTLSLAEESTAPTAITSGVTGSMATGATAAGLLDTAVTLGTASLWNCLSIKDTLAVDAIGPGHRVDFNGEYVIPPKMGFGLGMVDESGTSPKYGAGFTWAEVKLTYS